MINNFKRENILLWRRQAAFADATALYGYKFENDNGSVPQMKEAHAYVENWNKIRNENLGLLFWGLTGNGKTFAAACIANALIEQLVDVRMCTFGSILNHLPGMSAREKDDYLRSFRTCDLLILDDFGMERRTDYAREQIFGIIDGRYLAKKPTIITTNLSLQELKDPCDITEKRIFDRILEMCIPVCFDGESLRLAKAKENLKLYKQLTGK